jgi:hypothetical protein
MMMKSEKKFMIARWIGNPYQSSDKNYYGPFTFAEAMHCWEEWGSTGDSLALCDLEHNIIDECDWPADELASYAAHAEIQLRSGRSKR